MDEIRVLKINNGVGTCFHCGGDATHIVGGDYDVCNQGACFDLAIEKKESDLNYVHSRISEVRAQYRYEMNLDR